LGEENMREIINRKSEPTKGSGILVLDDNMDNLVANDKQFLSWIYDRLIYIYHENEKNDYMSRFQKIIEGFKNDKM
jgi:hypothetical protein